jgi:hypothetical protein
MHDFYAFFQLHPISDDAEDLAMKFFSATLHNNARRWYDGLPDVSITSMGQLQEVFLKRWNIKEDPFVLLNELNYIKKNENETVREFHDKFERLIQQITASHHSSNNLFLFLYTKAFTRQIGFPIRDKTPRTIQESYHMATEVEANISSSKEEQSFVPEVKIGESKNTQDIPKRIPSLETSVEETPKGLEQDIDQQDIDERELDEAYQSHGEEQ